MSIDRVADLRLSPESGRTGQGRFLDGLRIQARVIAALLLREFSARFGRENLGFLWAIGEPLSLATVITLIHVVEPNRFGSDIQPAPFAIIGYTIFIIFRGVVNKSEGVVDQNRDAFYHRSISIFDLCAVRTIIEAGGCVISFLILMTIALLTGYAAFPVRPLDLLLAIGLMIWWSFALSLIVVRVTYRNETMGRQIHVLSYFCIPISGAFFQLSSIPASFSNILRWFPMTLIFEQARYGQFRSASTQFLNPGYVIAVCAVLTYIGLLLTRRLRSRL